MEHATDDAHPLPSAQEDRPCHGLDDLFEAQVARRPEATALSFGDDTLTYRELSSRANRLARCLQKRGVGPDVLVGICLERSVEMALSVLAVLKAGGACVPLDPSYPRERLAFTLGDARPPLVLTTTGLLGRLPPSPAALLILDTEREALARESSERPAPRAAGQDAAYVIYTSGSTGTPKGVVMVTRSLASLVAWQVGDSRLGPGARTIQFSSLGFAISFQEILSTWCSGGTLVLVSEEVRRDPVRLLRFLADESIERLFVPFVALQQLAETALARELVPACLREIVTAGEQLRITRQVAGLMARLGRCTLQNQYGATESHIVTAFTLCGPSEAWPTLPPIGRPLPGARVTILGPDLQPAPTGVAGEICIGGERLARGYLGRPDLTAERFLPDPFRGEAGARLYRTGDAGRLLPDGNIEFLGRLDRQVKIRGYRVEPGEVEAALCEHPGVRQAIVVARGEPDGRHLLAYVVPAEGQGVDAGALRRFLEGKLPDYMVPSRFITLDALPLTPTGKVDRAALPVPDSARPELGVPFVAPRTPLERTLAGIWSEALEISPIGVRDSFLDLGGNSLKAMRLAARVRSAFCVDLPLATLFAAPTIEGQVASLTQALAEGTEAADVDRILNEVEDVPGGQDTGEEPRQAAEAVMHDDQASASPPGQDREPRAVAWRQPPDLLALPDDEVHVWRADLDGAAPHAQALGLVLDAGERLRAARFHFERDRSRFVVAHATLRDALARYLGTAPAALRFAAGPQGKPALAREPGQMDLRFNLSHSQGIALWAVARGREVGIDVERVHADLADEQVAARFFAPREVEAIRALPREQRLAAFFDCWTRKEAFVKAMGGGLSVPLDQFEVSVAPGGPAVLLSTRFDPAQASRWTLRALEPGEGYTAALAAGGRGWRLRCWEWRPEAGGARLEDGGRRDG